MKTCPKCKINKEQKDFNKSKRYKDGHECLCKECKHKNKQKWYAENKFKPNSRHKNAISNAKGRGLKFEIDLATYSKLIAQDCHYCQTSIEKEMGTGLDRLDSNDDYVAKNVVPCCTRCNISRNENFTPDEWKYMMKAYKEYNAPTNG